MRSDDQGRRLCTANAKSTGQLCRAPAVKGATVCNVHGAAKGTPARAKADNLILTELIGPALWRLKGLIDDKTTSGPVLISAIREVLDRTGYREWYLPTFDELRPHMDRLLDESIAAMSPDEIKEWEAKHA